VGPEVVSQVITCMGGGWAMMVIIVIVIVAGWAYK
jgi:hypothetical protein